MSTKLTGGCACGAIRFECERKALRSLNCHCRECQRYTGSGYIAARFVEADSFVITQGKPHYYTTLGDSGKKHSRGFCSTCGSPVCATFELMPDIVGVVVGALDDPTIHRPSMDIYTGMAQPWDFMDPDTLKFEAAPIERS